MSVIDPGNTPIDGTGSVGPGAQPEQSDVPEWENRGTLSKVWTSFEGLMLNKTTESESYSDAVQVTHRTDNQSIIDAAFSVKADTEVLQDAMREINTLGKSARKDLKNANQALADRQDSFASHLNSRIESKKAGLEQARAAGNTDVTARRGEKLAVLEELAEIVKDGSAESILKAEEFLKGIVDNFDNKDTPAADTAAKELKELTKKGFLGGSSLVDKANKQILMQSRADKVNSATREAFANTASWGAAIDSLKGSANTNHTMYQSSGDSEFDQKLRDAAQAAVDRGAAGLAQVAYQVKSDRNENLRSEMRTRKPATGFKGFLQRRGWNVQGSAGQALIKNFEADQEATNKLHSLQMDRQAMLSEANDPSTPLERKQFLEGQIENQLQAEKELSSTILELRKTQIQEGFVAPRNIVSINAELKSAGDHMAGLKADLGNKSGLELQLGKHAISLLENKIAELQQERMEVIIGPLDRQGMRDAKLESFKAIMNGAEATDDFSEQQLNEMSTLIRSFENDKRASSIALGGLVDIIGNNKKLLDLAAEAPSEPAVSEPASTEPRASISQSFTSSSSFAFSELSESSELELPVATETTIKLPPLRASGPSVYQLTEGGGRVLLTGAAAAPSPDSVDGNLGDRTVTGNITNSAQPEAGPGPGLAKLLEFKDNPQVMIAIWQDREDDLCQRWGREFNEYGEDTDINLYDSFQEEVHNRGLGIIRLILEGKEDEAEVKYKAFEKMIEEEFKVDG